ncbi:MAG: hypothetical protein JWM78_2052 [Verrucomicrobiaceae bacterium]|nr:hypothetical protein [Verrucomicrobiaceae bacterium]
MWSPSSRTGLNLFKRKFAAHALALTALTCCLPALAADVANTGAAGANGASGLHGKPGGSGGDGQATLLSSDHLNTASAAGGIGGNGGSSFLIFPSGAGGKGGKATVDLQSAGQADFEEDTDGSAIATAIGGAGGNGGAGGAAQARGSAGEHPDLFNNTPNFSLLVNATGGKGGNGLNGGAGGASTATGNFIAPSDQATVQTTSLGGAGGSAILQGGKGGSAIAHSQYDSGGQPAFNHSNAIAIGGNGGGSSSGRNGNGGAAIATADGKRASRGEGVQVEATAKGGASGGTVNPLSPRGNGGDAYATATAAAFNLPTDASATSTAQGGDGVARGGNAVASAVSSAPVGGTAHAQATGGAGKNAGAAIATSTATNDDGFGTPMASATAISQGSFVRKVDVQAAITEPFTPEPDRFFAGTVYAQARVGDTTGILAAAPNATQNPGLVARASAPTAAEASVALAGNTTVAQTFAAGSVWALGDFGTVNSGDSAGTPVTNIFENIHATSSYTFDISGIGNPQQLTSQHLWLGLLDSDLPADSIGNFHFSIAGGGQALFDHDFTGSDFLNFFDDRVFDLGSWAALAGADGLLQLDVAFAGDVSGIEFALGTNGNAVPEPSMLMLFGAGLVGLLMARKRSPTVRLQ